MNTVQTTPFQDRCVEELRRFFQNHEMEPAFEMIEGKNEAYLRSVFEFDGNQVDLYVYDDEAGFFWNGKWFIFERPDYPTDVELVAAFLASLEPKKTEKGGG